MADDLATGGSDVAGDVAPTGESGGGDSGFAPAVTPAPSHEPASYNAADTQQQPARSERPRVNGRFAKPPEPLHPPLSWQAEIPQKAWSQLDPDTQKYFADSELQRAQTFSEYGNRLKTYEPFDQVSAQYKDDLTRRGLQPAQAFHFLMEAQRQLDANPLGTIVQLGLSYGIDLRPLLEGKEQTAQQFKQLQQQYNEQLQQREQAAQAEAEARLGEFAKDKPYYNEVRTLMASFLQGGHAQTLQEAYDMAVNASPGIRARIRGEEQAKAAQEAKKRAAEALRAAKVNVRSSPVLPRPKTIEQTLNDLATRAYG